MFIAIVSTFVSAQKIRDYSTTMTIHEPNSDQVKQKLILGSLWEYQDLDNFQSNMTINSTHIFKGVNDFTLIEGKMLFCYISDEIG